MGIKHQADDFLVDEVLATHLPVRDRPAPFALYRLAKVGIDTPTALRLVARKLHVTPDDVAAGGLKDRYARTTQHISVKLTSRLGDGPDRAAGDDWNITRLGWLDEPIASSAIQGNRFRITVRDLSRRAGHTMDKAARLLSPDGDRTAQPASVRVVNYFGAQRFGSARHGEGFLAKNLIRGDFEGALKLGIATPDRRDNRLMKDFRKTVAKHWGDWPGLVKTLPRHPHRAAIEHLAKTPGDFRGAFQALPYFLQQISVEAYQSHLWNRIARKLVETHSVEDGQVIVAEDAFGEMWFPAIDATPREWVGLNLPLLASKTPWAEPWKDIAAEVFADEGIKPADLKIPGIQRPFFGESPRKLLVDATELAMSPLGKDDLARPGEDHRLKRVVSFTLPRGAYATVVLRALGL